MIYLLLLLLAAATVTGFIAIPGGTVLSEGTQKQKLGFADLMILAQNAGFTGPVAAIAAAVAMAESSGNPMAYNPETAAGAPQGKGSYGLWQIYLHAHPEFEGQNLYDPQTNANAAFKVYDDAGSFKPWSTFKNDAYLNFVPEGYNV